MTPAREPGRVTLDRARGVAEVDGVVYRVQPGMGRGKHPRWRVFRALARGRWRSRWHRTRDRIVGWPEMRRCDCADCAGAWRECARWNREREGSRGEGGA
jgi:hypothetical protein